MSIRPVLHSHLAQNQRLTEAAHLWLRINACKHKVTCLEQQTCLPWIRESGPAKQQLWRGHRRWQHKSTQASVGPCCNKWTLLLPMQQHTERRSSTPSVFGSDEAVAGTLEPRPWLRSARDARKAFAVWECCQFCRSSHLSSLPKALCTLWTPSLLTACLEAQH